MRHPQPISPTLDDHLVVAPAYVDRRGMVEKSTSMHPKDALGAYGEGLAAEFLRRQGMVILHRNWRCDAGELDVVARDGDALVICEVKTRRSVSHGTPLEAVGRRKLGKLRQLAMRYVTEQRIGPRTIRFDVVGIIQPWDGPPIVRHVRNV